MSLKIVSVRAEYREVKVELQTSRKEKFFAVLSSDGITFMSDESSSGGLYGSPITKSADDLLDWFGEEGSRKPFRERKRVKPQP